MVACGNAGPPDGGPASGGAMNPYQEMSREELLTALEMFAKSLEARIERRLLELRVRGAELRLLVGRRTATVRVRTHATGHEPWNRLAGKSRRVS